MAECFVCKGYYKTGEKCNRCQSDNRQWEEWQKEHAEERGGWAGLSAFLEPHLYAPLWMGVVILGIGLIGLGGAWGSVRFGIQLLVLLLAAGSCIIAPQAVYGGRRLIWEQQCLNRVRWKWGALLGDIKLWALILPALASLLVFLVIVGLVAFDLPWEMARWLLFEDGDLQMVEEGIRGRVLVLWPFILLCGYLVLAMSLAFATSLLPALRYAQEMIRQLPLPILVDDDLLSQVVRRAAVSQLDRPEGFSVPAGDSRNDQTRAPGQSGRQGQDNPARPASAVPPRAAGSGAVRPESVVQSVLQGGERTERSGRWNWEEIERLPDGGIMLRARSDEFVPLVASSAVLISQATFLYTVVASPWGRILRVSRQKVS